jgi:hypothetical protein
MQNDGMELLEDLGQAILDSSRSIHQEAVAQAIASALGSRGSTLELIYAMALNRHPGCCEQCSTLVPVFART